MTEHDEGRGDPTPEAKAGSGPDRSESLAAAEELAAREAAEEARRGPKVVRPTTRTSRKAATDAPSDGSPEAGAAPAWVTAVAPSGRVEVTATGTSDETVRMRQGGADVVSATNVDVSMGGIGRAQASDIAVSQGGIGLARAERVSVEMGGIGAAIGGEVRLTQGGAGVVLAREARVEQGFVRTLIANNVVAERTTGVLFLLAGRVDGNVRAVLDWRGALAFGAAFGLVTALFRRRK